MQYHVRLEKEGRSWNAIFADAPGCVTYGRSRAQAMAAAREALEGWLEAHLVDGRAPPRPAKTARNAEPVEVDPQLGLAIELRWARQEAGLSQTELASRVGVSQQQIAKLWMLRRPPRKNQRVKNSGYKNHHHRKRKKIWWRRKLFRRLAPQNLLPLPLY